MATNLTRLYNTMLMVKTEGESTKIMADCLRFVEKLISEENAKQVPAESSDE